MHNGVKKRRHYGVFITRWNPQTPEALIHNVQESISLNVTLDGGTWSSCAGKGASVSSALNSFLDQLDRDDHQNPFAFEWLAPGQTIAIKAKEETMFDPNEEDDVGLNAFIKRAIWCNTRSVGKSLNSITSKPKQRPARDGDDDDNDDVTPTDLDDDAADPPAPDTAADDAAADDPVERARALQRAREQARQAAARRDALAADPGADHVMVWSSRRLRAMKFDPAKWHEHSSVDAGESGSRYGIEEPVEDWTLVRWPKHVQTGDRVLQDPAWGDLSVVSKAGMCILHGAMRCGEHLFELLLQSLISRFANESRVQTVVNGHLNATLGRLRIRKLAADPSAKKEKRCYPHSFDGSAVWRWIEDLYAGLVQGNPNLRACWTRRAFPGSKFLTSLCRTYSALGMQQELDQLYAALPVLQSFATGFRAAMQMRPGPDDYRLVAEELPRFAVEKARLWPGKLRWYDNHCLYHLPYMMRKWGSLGLISQQGMEGWQKMLNEVLRLGNGFANAGRIPRIVLRAGEARRAQYLLRRAARKPSPARWVFEQAALQTQAHCSETLGVQARCVQQLLEFEWPLFVLFWRRYMLGTHFTVRWVSGCGARVHSRVLVATTHGCSRSIMNTGRCAVSSRPLISVRRKNDFSAVITAVRRTRRCAKKPLLVATSSTRCPRVARSRDISMTRAFGRRRRNLMTRHGTSGRHGICRGARATTRGSRSGR